MTGWHFIEDDLRAGHDWVDLEADEGIELFEASLGKHAEFEDYYREREAA